MTSSWRKTGWPIVRIRDIGRLHGGGTPSRKRPEFFQGTIPWITGQDIPDSHVAEISCARDYVTNEAVQESATRVVPAGAVLVTTRVSVGKTAVAGCNICFSQDVTAILIHSTAIALPSYVAHFLRWRRDALLQKNQGSTIAGITRDSLALEQIPLPPLSEQQRIVDILQKAEEIRRLRAEAEAKTAELIPAIFHQALDTDSVSRKRPLGSFFEEKPNYGTMTPADDVIGSDGVVCLRVGNIQNNRIDLSDRKYVQRSSIDLARHTVRTGDIILARAIASEEHLGKAVVITPQENGFAFDSHLMRIRLRKADLMPEFLQVYLYSAEGRNAFLKQARQSAVQFNVNAQEMARVMVPYVAPNLQEQVVRAIQEAESICKALDGANTKGSFLNASLSAHAFSGQLTADWREAHQERLTIEARERDAALKEAGAAISHTRRETVQEMEAFFQDRTDGIYSDLNREQRVLLREIERMVGGVRYARYFSAQMLSRYISEGSLRRNPQAIEEHLAVFAARGLIIPVSREKQTEDTGEFVFGNVYRLPLRDHEPGEGEEGEPQIGDHARLGELERLAAQVEKERARS